MPAAELDSQSIQKAYARWAPIYDPLFGRITTTGRRAAVAAASKVGGRVLEVGVGTGIALPDYGANCRVIGLDLSFDMLKIARKRVDDGLPNVEGILQMDAGRLAFPDASFDCVVAMYLITVVPDPESVMAELNRVCKPGGEVILVNHFAAEGGIRALVEKAAAPFGDKLGWHPDFPFSRVMGEKDLTMVEKRPAGFGGLFTLVRFKKAG
jgi:phosphatidylethanolamine/phosphatidyl-N-methylethanolamine N-methyltransferase